MSGAVERAFRHRLLKSAFAPTALSRVDLITPDMPDPIGLFG
jgi:hypothetical protein